jgi:hypothetical protein
MVHSLVQDAGVAGRGRLPWPLIVGAALYLLLLGLGDRLLNDADTYWQIALGHWIVAQHAVPHVDTFSWTVAGKPWISSQWLAQVIFAQTFAAAGWTGVVVLTAAAIAGACASLTRVLLERLAPVPALALTVGAFVLASPHMVARPHALALPVMVAWTAGLVRACDERRTPSLWLLPFIALWANLHGSFTFGIALIAPFALEALLNAPRDTKLAVVLRWGGFGLLALAAACVTPYGPESILVTLRVLGLGPALSIIGEWQPQGFAAFGGFELCLLAAIGFALHRGLTLPPIRIAMVLGLLHMALSQGRNGDLLGLLAPLVVAAPLAPQLGAAAPRLERGVSYAGVAVLLLALVAVTASAPALATYRPRAEITPQAAVEAVKRSGKTHILNSYDFGGYLIAEGIAPFIDGRTELYGGEFVLRHHRAVTLQDVGDFLRLLHDDRIDVTMLSPGTPAVGLLDRLAGWTRLYADDIAVVHVRTASQAETDRLK